MRGGERAERGRKEWGGARCLLRWSGGRGRGRVSARREGVSHMAHQTDELWAPENLKL